MLVLFHVLSQCEDSRLVFSGAKVDPAVCGVITLTEVDELCLVEMLLDVETDPLVDVDELLSRFEELLDATDPVVEPSIFVEGAVDTAKWRKYRSASFRNEPGGDSPFDNVVELDFIPELIEGVEPDFKLDVELVGIMDIFDEIAAFSNVLRQLRLARKKKKHAYS